MKWKFWTRTKAEPAAQPSIESIQWPTDSYESVRMLARIHADRDITLFSGWRADGVKLPEELEQLTEVGCRGLMLALWFWRFEDSHGALAGRMARDEFQLVLNEVSENLGDMTMSLIGMMDRSKDSFIKMPEERRRVTVDGKSIELPFQWFCALTLLVQTTDSPYYGRDDSEFDGIELPMMECLAHSTEIANRLWKPMIAGIGPFNPASYRRWQWSSRPGAFERHLQRRNGNPLFDAPRQIVDASEVYYARVRDRQALEDVRRRLAALCATFKEGTLTLNQFREGLDLLSDRIAEVDGDCSSIEAAILSLRQDAIATWRESVADKPEGLARLDEAETAYQQSLEHRCAWASHVRNPDGPIPADEVIPSLLSESVDEMRAAVALLEDTDGINETREACLALVMRTLAEGRAVPEHRQRLSILGVQI